MNIKKNGISLIIIFVLFIIIYKNFFQPGIFTKGDSTFIFPSAYTEFSFSPQSWDPQFLNGFGGYTAPLLGSFPSTYLLTLLTKGIGLNFELAQRVRLFYPFFLLSLIVLFYFHKKLLPNIPLLFPAIIFLFNTYILMIVYGGQGLIALAYTLALGIITYYITNRKNFWIKEGVFFGILLAIEISLDLRVTYMTYVILVIYEAILLLTERNVKAIFALFIAALTTCSLHAFWLLPAIIKKSSPLTQLGAAYTSQNAVQYFSFAKLENTLSLLHPNWPENIFGLTHFMRPEFLLFPILAYSALLFLQLKKTNKKLIIFFALLGLLGAFLAKGTNEPFGQVYLWLFDHIPGFIMFRDPTKWYMLVAISYTYLIPITIIHTSRKLNYPFKQLFYVCLCLFFLWIISPVLSFSGNRITIPNEYKNFAELISAQPSFSRTLWIPTTQRFAYASNTHPIVSSYNFFHTTDPKEIFKTLRQPATEKRIQEASISYIVIPYDSEKEIFLTDRKYDDKKYKDLVYNLEKISWLKQEDNLGKIKIFKITNPKDHFWSPSQNIKISYNYINPTKYLVKIKNAKRGEKIIFTETYDTKWTARITKEKNILLSSSTYNLSPQIKMNSFLLPKNGNYTLEVYYQPQDWVKLGTKISLTSFLLIITILLAFSLKKKLA